MRSWIRYGLIAGGVLSVLMFAPALFFGPDPEWMRVSEILGYTAMVLCLTATFFAMRAERNRRGSLHLGEAFKIGVGVALIAALLFGLATWVFYAVSGDALPEAIYQFYVRQVQESGKPPEAIAAQLAEMEKYKALFFNEPFQAAVMFATVFVIGVAESLLGAWLVRRPA